MPGSAALHLDCSSVAVTSSCVEGNFCRRDSLASRAAVLQQSLFEFLLARDAMPRPGYCFQPLGIDLIAAGDALAKGPLANAAERAVHHLKQLALVVTLVKQEFLVVRVGRPVRNVLRRFHIGFTAVLSGAIHGVPQFPLAVLQAFFENL